MRAWSKSNEISALPELLALLALEGQIVTADAMHAQKATAEAMLAGGGDYGLALKGNQPALFKDVTLLLNDPDAPPGDIATTTDGDHGRIETRRAEICTTPPGSPKPTAFQVSRPSAGSPRRARSTASRPPPPAPICFRNPCPRRASPRSSARTGRSRTHSTGSSTW
jgi:hypothetical protein